MGIGGDKQVCLCQTEDSLKTKAQNKESRFEESLERLEALVQEMESGNLPLEEIIKKYEEGNRLVKLCAAKLNEAEQRIEVLMKDKDGSLGLQPFAVDEDEAEETTDKEAEETGGRNPSPAKDKDLF